MDSGVPIKKGRHSKKLASNSEKTSPKDEDALQKEKASILNRIKKKLHIKKEEGNGNGSNEESKSPEMRRQGEREESIRNRIGSSQEEEDDMRMYDASDTDEDVKYVPSVLENKHKLTRSGSNKQQNVDNGMERMYKGHKTFVENDGIEENDEVLMEKGEEEDFIEEVASWDGIARKGRGPADSQSLDEATVSAIISEKLNNLDFRKQKYLLRVLEKIERGELATSVDPRLTTSLDQLMKIGNDKPTPQVRLLGASKEITLRILSNWGDKSHVGLTGVDIFDQTGQPVSVPANCIRATIKSNEGLAKLLDGQSKTIEEKHMWLVSSSKLPMDIIITIPDNKIVSKLKLWNYNKTVKDANKGVQECEIWVGGNCWWRGIVEKGCGNQLFDYATIIPLIQPESSLSNQPHQPHQPAHQKPDKQRPHPKKGPPPSFLTVEGGAAPPPQRTTGILPRSTSNDGRKPMQEPARSMSRSLPPKADPMAQQQQPHPTQQQELFEPELSSEKQSKPIWLANGVGDSTLKRQQELTLDLANASSDESPLSTRKARPHSRHSREAADKEKEKEKEKEMGIFGGQKMMVKSPSFEKSPIFAPNTNSPSLMMNTNPNPGPTPRRSRLANSSSDPSSLTNNTSSPSITSATSNPPPISNLLYANNSSSGSLDIKSQSKKRITTIDLNEAVGDYVPSFRGGEETARRKRDTAYNPSSSKDKEKQIATGNYSIEQSWENLNFFNVKQMGRIKETKDSSVPQTIVSSPSNPISVAPISSPVVPTPRSTLSITTPRNTAAHTPTMPSSTISRSPAISSYTLSSLPSLDFTLPSLPCGQIVDIIINSTWGDPYYVGLSGIDFFDAQGKFIIFPEPHKQITANPSDINELPGYGQDPRTIDKLVDGHQRSCDDLHVWLAPFTPGHKNEIKMVFTSVVSLSLIRIWNYNKSRIHSFRGAKEIEIRLDGNTIFRGQLKKAPGILHQSDEAAEYILFTQDDSILAAIEQNDPMSTSSRSEMDESNMYIGPRPKTGDKRKSADMDDEFALLQLQHVQSSRADGRPTTAAIITPRKDPLPSFVSSPPPSHPLSGSGGKSFPSETANYPTGKQIIMRFLSTWGDRHYMGLTGFVLYDPKGKPIAINSKQLWAHPRDINDMPGAPGDDDRTLDKLVDGTNNTMSDHHMWLIPFATTSQPTLKIDLLNATTVAAMRVWNYNKNMEDSFRGAKLVSISMDDVQLGTEPYVFRKAPGIADFDFGQYISFANYEKRSPDSEFVSKWDKAKNCKPATAILPKLDYQMFPLPCGHILKFLFLSSWGDPHYVGLNGLEVYDWNGHMVPISAKNSLAIPSSVAVLPEMRNDARTLPNLFNGINDTFDDRHMWLAPLTGSNVLYVVINDATAISMIKMWNYAKTPMRGVEEFELYVDDLLVYKGVLKMAPPASSGPGSKFGQTILFSYEDKFVTKEKDSIYSLQSEQHVQFINDNQVVIPVKKLQNATAPQARPSTSVGSRNT